MEQCAELSTYQRVYAQYSRDDVECVVISKQNCVQCNATQRKLRQLDVAYLLVEFNDLTLEQQDELVNVLNVRQAPIVLTRNDYWSGYNVDKLRRLKNNEGTDEH